MTLKTRNNTTLFLFSLSIAALLFFGIFTLHAFRNGTLSMPEIRLEKILSHFYSNKYTFASAMISLFVFVLYASSVSIYFFITFEKTHSTEIIFFSIFLIGCMTEIFRVMIPLFDLWHNFSQLSTISGRTVFFGRMISPLGLVATSIASGDDQRQNTEQNIAICYAVAIITAMIMPLDVVHVSQVCMFSWGHNSLFSTVRVLMVFVAALSQFLNVHFNGSSVVCAIGFSILCIGYLISCATFSIFTLVAGTVMLTAGTVVYLNMLHKQYLWI